MRPEFESLEALDTYLAQDGLNPATALQGAAFQHLNLSNHTEALLASSLYGALFLDCKMSQAARDHADASGALFFPAIPDLPFHPYRNRLYSPLELMDGFAHGSPTGFAQTVDNQIYEHYMSHGGPHTEDLCETIARRLHDHAITDGVQEFLAGRMPVAVMGGHAMKRTDKAYRDVAYMAMRLTEAGYLLVSGGGPGAMEATNLGGWLAGRDLADLDAVLEILAAVPSYKEQQGWLETAFVVRERFPCERGFVNLGIPTWLYGHEPPNIFATHIAKYFANSVREDGLLAIALGGVIFSPGSAGTIQEIFQDAAQNHYKTMGVVSPMIFFDKTYWTETKPVYPLMRELAAGYEYGELLSVTDDPDEVIRSIMLSVPLGN